MNKLTGRHAIVGIVMLIVIEWIGGSKNLIGSVFTDLLIVLLILTLTSAWLSGGGETK